MPLLQQCPGGGFCNSLNLNNQESDKLVHCKSLSNYEPEGREFESLQPRQLLLVKSDTSVRHCQPGFWCIDGCRVDSAPFAWSAGVTEPIERDAIYRRRRFSRETIETCVRW